MAATATARTAPARRAPARKPARHAPAPARRRQQTPIGGFVPVAVGRTAGAVGGIADSGLFVWLTRGRIWIGALGALLVGIVALNVIALSFSSASSDAGRQADQLELQNSSLRAELATTLSSEEVQRTAARLGLVVPDPGSITYLKASSDDAAEAARRLRSGELTTASYGTPVANGGETTTPTTQTVPDPAATATETATATEPAVTPTDPATTATESATTATAPPVTADSGATTPVAGGGLAAP